MERPVWLRLCRAALRSLPAEAKRGWKQVTDNYRIESSGLEPIVAFAVNGGSLEFAVSYIVDYAERTVMKDLL